MDVRYDFCRKSAGQKVVLLAAKLRLGDCRKSVANQHHGNPRIAFGNDLKALSYRGENGLLAGDLLEASLNLVAIGRIELNEPCTATAALRRQETQVGRHVAGLRAVR